MKGSASLARVAKYTVGTALGAIAFSSAATAQDAAAPPPAPRADDQTIVVTGSHVLRDGAKAPTPVTVVDAAQLEARAQTNVGEALNELPSFRPLVTPATQQAVGGNVGARVLDLRGLGAARTLVLLNGKRFVPSTTLGTIDVNLMPTALISRTEVVTGGASAAYGSDAVAGVVNFILDRNFTGFKGSVQGGISQRGDDKEYNVSLAYGTRFSDGRGHTAVSLEYDDAKGMGDCYTRVEWCPNQMLLGNSPPGTGGLPANLRLGPNTTGNVSVDGLINVNSGPLRGISFNPDGTPRPYHYGQFFGTALQPLFTLSGTTGEEPGSRSFLQGITLLPPSQRYVAFADTSYDFSDALKANLDISYGEVRGLVHGSGARVTDGLIQRDNAYLPAAVATIMDNNGINSFLLGRSFIDRGGSLDNSVNRTYRVVPSLEGKISSHWSWDAYYQYGQNDFKQVYTGDAIVSRIRNALDAVNSGGKIVCRINADATTANDDPSCAPLDPFGRGNLSDAAWAYVTPTGFQTAHTVEHVAAANVHGDLFRLPGGMVAIAAGAEYRDDTIVGTADPYSTTNQFWSFNGKAINGEIKVAEAYVEADAPIVKDLPFANLLELNGAARRTHYDRSSPGTTTTSLYATTWKAGVVYEPIEQVRLRATRSRDIRAPNLTELFGPVTSGRVQVVDGSRGNPEVTVFTGANPLVQPEIADTWTGGIVLTPNWSFARSLRLSVDYYQVSITGAIATLGAATIVARCNAGATEFCPYVTRNGAGNLVSVADVLNNVAKQVNRGIDIEASYHAGIGSLGALDLRVLATHYLESSTRDSVGLTNRVGQTGYRPGTTTGVPWWIADANIDWHYQNVTFGVHGHYIPKGIYDVTLVGPEDPGYSITLPNSVNTNRVNGRLYLDLNASLKIGKAYEVFGVINNVLDKNPPLAGSGQGGTNQVYFDPIGRYLKAGFRVKI